MDQVGAFLTLVVPVLIVFYLACLLFIRAPKAVVFASLLGGMIMGLVNLLVDIAAYYAHWWHYTLNEVILHVPLPFYISSILTFGSLAYLLIWRFWYRRTRWFAYLLLAGVPLFCMLRDIIGDSSGSSYVTLDNATVAPFIIAGMWLVAFFGGLWLFWHLAGQYASALNTEENKERTA